MPRPLKNDAYFSSATEQFGAGAGARPVAGTAGANHPQLLQTLTNGMHGDSNNSDTHPYPGSLSSNIRIQSANMSPSLPGGECGNYVMNKEGIILVFCADFANFAFYAIDPVSKMRIAAKYKLPRRASGNTLNIKKS